LLDDGRRAWGTTSEPALTKAMVTEDVAGQRAHITADGDLTFA
jgi:hypothetical protein